MRIYLLSFHKYSLWFLKFKSNTFGALNLLLAALQEFPLNNQWKTGHCTSMNRCKLASNNCWWSHCFLMQPHIGILWKIHLIFLSQFCLLSSAAFLETTQFAYWEKASESVKIKLYGFKYLQVLIRASVCLCVCVYKHVYTLLVID